MAASPNLIQIKRSQTTGQPASLANGELAFTSAGNVVFIGNYGQVLPIAGQRTPGTLTANQALVANSTSGIDKVIVANLVPTSVFANGSVGGTGFLLSANGTGGLYWKDPSTVTVGTQYVTNTDSRVLSGSLTFTGSNTTITSSNTQITNLNVTNINRSPTLTLSGDVTGSATFSNLGDATLNVTVNRANGVILGVDTTGDYVADIYAGDGISIDTGTGAGSTPTISIPVGSGLISNGAGVFLSTDQEFENLTINASTTLNGNVTLGDAIQDRVTLNGSLYGDVIPTVNNGFNIGGAGAIYNTGYFTKLQLGSSSDSTVTASGNTIQMHSLTVNSEFTSNTATVYHNLVVGGDIFVTGNVVSANVDTINVSDPLIHLGANNHSSDALDLGFFADYYDGQIRYSGLVRDASDKVFKLFDNLTDLPLTYVNTASSSYRTSTLDAFLQSGALTSNGQGVTLLADGSHYVNITANTLTLTSPLATGSGGTGYSTYNQGDLLVGTAGGSLATLGKGTAGYVLQSDGTTLVYASIDGGTF